jgi:hypothetical protein
MWWPIRVMHEVGDAIAVSCCDDLDGCRRSSVVRYKPNDASGGDLGSDLLEFSAE